MHKPRGSVPKCSLFRLAPLAFVLVSAFAFAQQQPSCVPNTANYPCVYVANSGSRSVSVINATTNKVIGAVSLGPSTVPRGLAVTPDNAFVYVASEIVTKLQSTPEVEVIDTATGAASVTIKGLSGQFPSQVAITPDGKFAYVVEVGGGGKSPAIDRIDTASNTVVDSITGIILLSGTSPSAIVIAPSGALAYVAVPCASTNAACVDVVDTTTTPPTVTSSIPILDFTGAGSIAITPDGSVVCDSVVDPNSQVAVACINTTTGSQTELGLNNFAGPTSYGLATTPNGTMYAAEPGDPAAPLSVVASIDPNTTPPTLLSNIQVGLGPTGVASGPGGQTVYVSDADDNTVSIIDAATNSVVILGSGNGFSSPQGVAAMSASPPVIVTQPASQIIGPGQAATLSVVATSAAPVFYQWYQGLAGDLSSPVQGAVNSSFTTPPLASTTSYWVQVSNVAGAVNSNTATVTVTSNQPPTCVLSVAGNGTPDFSNLWLRPRHALIPKASR